MAIAARSSGTTGQKRKRASVPGGGRQAPSARKQSRLRPIAAQQDIQAHTTASNDLSGCTYPDLNTLDSLEIPAVEALATGFRSGHQSAPQLQNGHHSQQAYPNQHFTQHWTQCQNQELGCQDPHDPLACSWEDFQAMCGPCLPCSNPNCEDVSPCPSAKDECPDPLDCLGTLCWDEQCPTDAPCNQHCDVATRCASPCFSDECRVPACDAPCIATAPAVNGASTEWMDHERRAYDILCRAQTCEVPGITCVDPQCIHQGYQPASHVHHPIQEYYKHEHAYHQNNNPNHAYRMGNVNPQEQPALQYQTDVGNSGALISSSRAPVLQAPQQQYFEALKPVRDFNGFPSDGQNLGYSCDHTVKYTHHTPPRLAHSLASTPKSASSASQDLYGLAITRPATSAPQIHTCLWSATPNGKPSQPCRQTFTDAAELHIHVERTHIDTLQRTIDDTSTPGYHCRWANCPRNTHRHATPAPYTHASSLGALPDGSEGITPTTTTSFAARPKLKRHLQTHTHHTPYNCPFPGCTAVMKTRDAMTKHARTHTGERPYACPVPDCGKIFATSTELKTHTVVHSGLKPHVCSICGEGFADSSNLSKHRKTHEKVGMYRCPQEWGGCGCRMKRWDQMRRHWVGRRHCVGLLDDEVALKEYKESMEREFKELTGEPGEA